MVTVSAGPVAGREVRAHIDVDSVSHHFELDGEQLPVLDDVRFSIQQGEFVALLGPSGCGKSTLLRLVSGLDRPVCGQIRVNGEAIVSPDPSRVVVFQDPTLYPWRTVRGNVGLGPDAQRRGNWFSRDKVREERAKSRIDAALDLVGLGAFAKAFPHQLSGGMAQRVALARALVNDPALLLLDEPFGKLDSLTRIKMQSELVRIWKEGAFSVLLVTHDVEEALMLANRVVVFSERPARIVSIVENDMPFPRHRDDPKLVALRKEVLAKLGLH